MLSRRYEDKVALVTGGASGIGLNIVKALVGEGARVAFTDIGAGPGQALELALRDAGGDVMFLQADATLEADVERSVAQVVERWGRLDVGINNVGNMGSEDKFGVTLADTPMAAWLGTLDVSLNSTFLGMKHQIRQMKKQGGGVIANTASMAGINVSQQSTPAYSIAKAGVVHLTRYAAVHHAKDNIRVNVVAPGLTATPAVMNAFPTEEKRNFVANSSHPMGRMMTPMEVADAFLWVCSDQATGITGLVIPVSGGWAAK